MKSPADIHSQIHQGSFGGLDPFFVAWVPLVNDMVGGRVGLQV